MVLDCAHGATYHIAPLLFRELGADVITIGAEPNGVNINDGVGSMHVESLAAKVRETGAHLGIAFDGDGDRVLMADANGVPVDGDQLIYLQITRGVAMRDHVMPTDIEPTVFMMTNAMKPPGPEQPAAPAATARRPTPG